MLTTLSQISLEVRVVLCVKLHLSAFICVCWCDPDLFSEDFHAAIAVCANPSAKMCACLCEQS